jgi:hypothetical protein
MADSENSRTLPPITHRNLLPVTERFLQDMATEQGGASIALVYGTLTKWEAWWRAHTESARLCNLQQRLEAELFRTVDAPSVEIRIPTQINPAIASTPEEIDAWLEGEEFAELRASAKAELADRRREWDTADQIIGYSRAKEAEAIAAAGEHRLAEELWATSEGSVVCATAKLHCVVAQGEPEPNSGEFPWPQLRSVLMDLLIIGAAIKSIPSGL